MPGNTVSSAASRDNAVHFSPFLSFLFVSLNDKGATREKGGRGKKKKKEEERRRKRRKEEEERGGRRVGCIGLRGRKQDREISLYSLEKNTFVFWCKRSVLEISVKF